MGQLPGQQNWLEWQSKKWFKWDHNGAPSVWSKQNLNMAKYNVIEIEGLLFPGFGQMQVHKFFPSSDVMRALKMELYSWKNLSAVMCMTSLDGKNRFFSWKICAPAFAQTLGIANLLFQIMLMAPMFFLCILDFCSKHISQRPQTNTSQRTNPYMGI